MQNFAIYEISSGSLISSETDTTTQRLSDSDLALKGLARIAIDSPIDGINIIWDSSKLTTKTNILEIASDELLRQSLITVDPSLMNIKQSNQALQLILKTIHF